MKRGQGDGQAERHDQPKKCYERDALLPASRTYMIVPEVLKHGLFLSGYVVQAAPDVLPIGSKAGVQTSSRSRLSPRAS